MSMSMMGCAGRDRVPTMEEKTCPQCGSPIEIFSTDAQMECENCGYVIYNKIIDCVQWCKYAKLCVGEELYNKLMSMA